jgi:hypothetical protein
MLPGCPDCDFHKGEKIFTPEEVASFCHEYNTKFRLNDEMHLYGITGNVIGESVENWTLKQDTTTTNILGKTVNLPKGTWMTTVKISDDETWNKIENGTYQGFSGSYIPRTKANELLEKISANKSIEPLTDYVAEKDRVLIKDIDDPVPVTISVVTKPCVPNAIFTAIKSQADKAGRTISNTTLSKLNKVFNSMQSGLNSIKDLLTKAEIERTPTITDGVPVNPESAIKEVENMDEDEFKKLIKETIEEELSSIKSDIEELKNPPEPEAEPEPEPEPEPEEEEQEEQEKEPDETAGKIEELEQLIQTQSDAIASLKSKIGEKPDSDANKGQEDDQENKADKYEPRTDRDVFGRKIKGGE